MRRCIFGPYFVPNGVNIIRKKKNNVILDTFENTSPNTRGTFLNFQTHPKNGKNIFQNIKTLNHTYLNLNAFN